MKKVIIDGIEYVPKKEKKEKKEENKNKRPRLKVNEYYSYINDLGNIEKSRENFEQLDDYRYAIGNYAVDEKEKKEIIKQKYKQFAIMRVKDWIRENLGEFEPNWRDNTQNKYYFFGNLKEGKIYLDFDLTDKHYSPIGYLKSKSDTIEVIENCEEDLKIIFDIK